MAKNNFFYCIQYPELLNQTPSTELIFVSTSLESVPDLYFNHLWLSQAPSELPYPQTYSIFLRGIFQVPVLKTIQPNSIN